MRTGRGSALEALPEFGSRTGTIGLARYQIMDS